MILQNLDPDTPYDIKVTAIYADGPGGELEGNGRTGKDSFGFPFACFIRVKVIIDHCTHQITIEIQTICVLCAVYFIRT